MGTSISSLPPSARGFVGDDGKWDKSDKHQWMLAQVSRHTVLEKGKPVQDPRELKELRNLLAKNKFPSKDTRADMLGEDDLKQIAAFQASIKGKKFEPGVVEDGTWAALHGFRGKDATPPGRSITSKTTVYRPNNAAVLRSTLTEASRFIDGKPATAAQINQAVRAIQKASDPKAKITEKDLDPKVAKEISEGLAEAVWQKLNPEQIRKFLGFHSKANEAQFDTFASSVVDDLLRDPNYAQQVLSASVKLPG